MEKRKSKKSVAYYLLYAITYLHALLPFSVLYVLSDFLYFVIYYLVKYRRKLVRKNLLNSFPTKSEEQIIEIEKRFYHHLCDYYVETIKTLNITDDEVKRRMKFENPEIIDRLTADGRSCILSLGHYANWEWVPSIGFHLSSGVKTGLMYKELHSKSFDGLFLKVRTRFNSIPIEMLTAYRKMIEAQNKSETLVVGFLSDQRPPRSTLKHWIEFMNQDTPIQIGMERIARKLSCSIVYLDVKKVKRGFYVGKFHVITTDASEEPELMVMKRYMRKLEETIMREPAYYLWSHNRWKFKKGSDEVSKP